MKNFTMKDESFTCENCGKKIKRLNYTARDHCNYCLFSKHVDVMPGDRQNKCCGLLIYTTYIFSHPFYLLYL